MKLVCTKENLLRSLSLVGGVANKNTNLPILGNVLIRADQQKAELVATNLELATIAHMRAKVEAPGSFTVPARTLLDFVSLLSDERVEIELIEHELVVTCGRSATKIKGSPAEEFPVVPSAEDGNGFMFSAQELHVGLAQVIPALAKNDIRPELSGVFFGFNCVEGMLCLAATDSYRLAEKKIKIIQGNKEELRVVVPGRTAQEINHVLSVLRGEGEEQNVRVLVTNNQITINYNGVQLVSRLVEGQYPDYTQIIPKDFRTTTLLSAEQLTKEIKAASLFTAGGTSAISCKFDPQQGVIMVSSSSSQTGEYKSEVAADIKGESNSVLLNHRYVLDGLNNIKSDHLLFKMVNPDSPCLLVPESDESYLYIVMPIRQ